MSAESTALEIISIVKENSQTAINAAIDYAGQASTASSMVLGSWNTPVIEEYEFLNIDPTQFNPIQDLRGDYESKYNEMFDKLYPLAKKEFTDFMATAFPSEQCWSKLSTFLCDAIDNGRIGLPEHIENSIWQRANDREMIKIQGLTANIYSEAAQRGFSMPPAWTLGTIAMANNEAGKNLSALNRDIAIEVAKLRIEFVKFSIEKIISMRQMALQSAVEFMHNIYKSADAGNTKAQGYTNSYQSFYNSMNAYYNSVNSVNELKFKIKATNAENKLKNHELWYNATLENNKVRVSGLVELAKSMGTLAASSSSGLNALGSVGYQKQE